MDSAGRIGVRGQMRSFRIGTSGVRVLVEASETKGRFAMIRWSLPPEALALPQHIHHGATETFFVVRGELVFPMGEDRIRMTAGECLHIPPDTPHTLSNPGESEAEALEILSPGSLLGLAEAMGELLASGRPSPEDVVEAMRRFASEPAPPV